MTPTLTARANAFRSVASKISMSSCSETDRQLKNGRTGHLDGGIPGTRPSRKAGKPCRTSLIASGLTRAFRRPHMAALPAGTVTFLFTDIEGPHDSSSN